MTDSQVTARRVMLITGASRGIGAATAQLAASAGWDVAVNYRESSTQAAAVAESCRAAGRRAIVVQADVADEAAVIAMFDSVEAELGQLTCLVNNAGVLHQQMRIDEMTASRWREVFEINVIGALLCSREAVRRMSSLHGGSGGSIVNVSSASSYLGSPGEYVDYAATKGALDTITVGLGREVASEGIRVNAVRPGPIDTEIHASGGEPDRLARVGPTVPMQRGGEPEEVARTILWLASDEASYVTATFVNCSGGR